MDLTLDRWKAATPADREEIARRLAGRLPTGFAFESIREFELGDHRNPVATYRLGGSTFALIPGGEATLGHDADRPWEPNPDELESWQDTAEEYEFDESLDERIAQITSRPRRVEFRPILVETAAVEQGWVTISPDDREVKALLKRQKSAGTVTQTGNGVATRVRRHEDGTVTAERSVPSTPAGLAEKARADGFRFPTSDEWEYACAGGDATTLFRWGDHAPCDRYPTDISPEESAWRKEWVFSGGKLEYPAGGFRSAWDLHRRPNAFGLFIAESPYHHELVDEVGTTRGGDGGGTICGGAGFFVGWLTLATAYFEEYSCRHDPSETLMPGFYIGRRVLDLA